MKLSDFWENNVPKGWKHFTDHMDNNKKNYIIKNINKYFFKYINFSNIFKTLEWGCGGGLISQEFSKYTDIILLDISQESLNVANSFVDNVIYSQKINDNIDKFIYTGPQPDIIMSHAVIHHFPNYNYWKKVLKIWKLLNPTYIAIHVKIGDKTKEAKDYFEERNYLNGLIFNENDLISDLLKVNYKLINKDIIETLLSNQKISGFFVFKNDN